MEFNFEEMTQELVHLPESMVESRTETTAHIFGIENKENYISNWLAFLINPARFGSAEPLNAFLELCFNKMPGLQVENYKVENAEQVEILREEVVGEGHRIDIIIHTEKLLIGIECKIHAPLHHNQLLNYQNSLYRKIKTEEEKVLILILLTPAKNEAKPTKDFLKVTYEELADSFSELHYDYLNNMRSAFLLEDFVNYVKEYMGGRDSSMNEEWANFISSNSEELQTVVREGKENLKRFEEDLIKCLNSIFQDEQCEHKFGKSTHNQFWFQLNYPEWDKFDIHYEVGIFSNSPTHGFILPEKLRLTLDVENNESKRILRDNTNLPFKDIKTQNEIEVIDMNYSNSDEIQRSLENIKDIFIKWHEEYGIVIENALVNTYEN